MRFLIIFMTCLFIVGCNHSETPTNDIHIITDDNEIEVESIIDKWTDLVSKDAPLDNLTAFLHEHLKNVSTEDAEQMINEFEEMQIDYLPQLEEKYFNSHIQEQLFISFDEGKEFTELTEGEVGRLIKETLQGGYKIETAEGTFFPIIDYRYYETFSPYLSDEMQDYIEIMAIESDQSPAKDAAIVVSWGELVERAVVQEGFLQSYPQSKKTERVRVLYDNYVMMILFGLNNTPLFRYDDNEIALEAVEAYKEAVEKMNDSETKTIISQFLELIHVHEGKLTEEIEQFRNDIKKR